MQAGPSNTAISAAPVSQIKKRRIPQAGIAIMEGESPSHPDGYQALNLVFAAWLNQHGSNPTQEDRNVMLYKIRLIPGGENYDDKGVIEWFKRRRRLANSPYRTLSTKAMKHLTTLALSNPYPSPGLITTWAELLHASTDDITKWLAEHRSPVRHLPTPVSTSPEPASDWTLKADPVNSPVIPSRNVPTFCSTHVNISIIITLVFFLTRTI
ncbi:hypothetical protein C0992_011674 [Termitomyces sp. T32_za158]|nr:hypothetical protein C0992_011674 [Termitomyces sp. T32_za158]